jgi:hypothetical protein
MAVTVGHAAIVTMMDVFVAADGRGMVVFPIEFWTVIWIIGGGTVLAILAAASNARREECRLHDLKVQVHELRSAYQRRLADLRRGQQEVVAEAEIVEEPLTSQAA